MKKIFVVTFLVILSAITALSCKSKSSPAAPASTATPQAPVLTLTITPTSTITESMTITATITITATATATVTATATRNYAEITGSILMPADQTGYPYQVIVDLNTDFSDGFYMKSGTCPAGTSVPYSLTGPAGTYYIYAVVKLQSSAMEPPKPGDYVGIYDGAATAVWPDQVPQQVTVVNNEVKTGINIKVDQAFVNLNGTYTPVNPSMGIKGGAVFLDADNDPTNGYYSTDPFITVNGQANYAYNLLCLFPGDYMLYGFIDLDGSNSINSGDDYDIYNGGSQFTITDIHVGSTGSPRDLNGSIKP